MSNVDVQEYLDAGFTPEQTALLVRRDRRVDMLEDSMNRGFADVLTTIRTVFGSLERHIDRLHERDQQRIDALSLRLEARLATMDQRLDAIEAHLRRTGPNGEQERGSAS